MNMVQFLNSHYGYGWTYDQHNHIWLNVDGRVVVKVMIGNQWRYQYVADNGTTVRLIDPYKERTMKKNGVA